MTTDTQALHLQIVRDESKTERRQMTEGMLDPAVRNAEISALYAVSGGWGNVGLTEAMQILTEKAKAVNNGDLSDVEATLVAQSAALNSIFVEMARRAHTNMGTHLEATERYMKLALKAQSQCRTTIETLALVKNPPVYARQANINNGGQQLVNNGALTPANGAHSFTHDQKRQQNELLEQSHGERLDTGTKSKARRGNQTLETVGEVHRSKVARR